LKDLFNGAIGWAMFSVVVKHLFEGNVTLTVTGIGFKVKGAFITFLC
jgi:hypothetical protein